MLFYIFYIPLELFFLNYNNLIYFLPFFFTNILNIIIKMNTGIFEKGKISFNRVGIYKKYKKKNEK